MRKGARMVPLVSRDEYLGLLRSSSSLLAQFEASWCGDCHSALPELEAIADRFRDELTVLRMDADTDRRLRDEFQLQGYPTYAFFEQGTMTASCFGAPEFGLTRLVEILVP